MAIVCTSAGGRGLAHHGLLHPATVDLAAALAPLVAGRLARDEPVLAALPPTTSAGLRDRLPTLAGLHTIDPAVLYRHPGRVLSYYRSWIGGTTLNDTPATIVAAPNPDGNNAHRAALWMHVEAVTTQALAEYDLTLVCAYRDEPRNAAAVRGAHPSLLNGAVTPSPDHLPAEQFVSRHPLPPPIELGYPDRTTVIDDLRQLRGLRRTATDHAIRAGLPSASCDDFVLAVSEVASNAIEHGEPPAIVRLWTTSTAVICEISDRGRHTEPLVGLLPPPANQHRGRGLWLAHQLCDQFYLWPAPTTIRLQMDRIPAA